MPSTPISSSPTPASSPWTSTIRAPRRLPIRDGAIVAVGDRASVGELEGPATRVIDAGGNSVVPGFIEAHMHLFAGAAELDHLQLSGVSGFDALAEAVRAYAAQRARRETAAGARRRLHDPVGVRAA